jgi:hypothetical protein
MPMPPKVFSAVYNIFSMNPIISRGLMLVADLTGPAGVQ